MKRSLPSQNLLKLIWALLIFPLFSNAQCELFKSELDDVKNYLAEVSQLTDSLQTFAESAAFAGQLKKARLNAQKAEFLMGQALTAADEAVLVISEAQYHSEICGIDAVKSYTIDAESSTLDAREFAGEAFVNAQKANKTKNLGDIRYYMRKSQNAIRDAKKFAEKAMYAAFTARSYCTHNADKITNTYGY